MAAISKIPFLGSLVLKDAVGNDKKEKKRFLLSSLSQLLDKPP